MDQTLSVPGKLPALIGLLLLQLVFLYPLLINQYQYYFQCVAYAHYEDVVKGLEDKYKADVEADKRAREARYERFKLMDEKAAELRKPLVQQAELRVKTANDKFTKLTFGPHPNIAKPFKNSLDMIFVPAGSGHVLFSIFDTTVSDFTAFVTASGYNAGYVWHHPGFEQGPNYPVVGVNWEEAEAFCKWLTDKEQKAGLLKPNQSYRLPSDSEWSMAAGLSEKDDGTPMSKARKGPEIYPWGGKYPPPLEAGNYLRALENSGFTLGIEGTDGYINTSPVGSFNPNGFGLYDMGGNVQQWCEDWSDSGHQSKVLRGAHWQAANPYDLLSSFRGAEDPKNEMNTSGFRCVLVVTPVP